MNRRNIFNLLRVLILALVLVAGQPAQAKLHLKHKAKTAAYYGVVVAYLPVAAGLVCVGAVGVSTYAVVCWIGDAAESKITDTRDKLRKEGEALKKQDHADQVQEEKRKLDGEPLEERQQS